VAANPGVQRSRTITIAGLTFTVTQDAVAAAPMQFSTATFTGSEASGIASITVNRTGDTSGTSAVEYLDVRRHGLAVLGL